MKRELMAVTCLACLALTLNLALAAAAPKSPRARSATGTTRTTAGSHAASRTGSKTASQSAARPVSAGSGHGPGVPDAVSLPLLSDSDVLARVADRVITVKDFNDAYFNGDPEARPGTDSLSRVGFLTSMVNKEVLGLVALKIDKPLEFEDRTTLRDHTNRVLSNVLYARMVIDSVQITDADIAKMYEQFKYEVHLKHIQVADHATAEQVRHELQSRRLPWSVAVRKYSVAQDRERDGDMGWRGRLGMDATIAAAVWELKPGELSEVLEDPQGFHVLMVSERRPTTAPALTPLRSMIHDQILGLRAGERQRDIQVRLISKVNVVYDEANIRWASGKFERAVSMTSDGQAPTIEINPNLPDVTTTDRARVLAHYKGGQVTMDQLLHAYESMPTMLRPAMNTVAAVEEQVQAIILEPTMLQLAYDRGLDKDPEAVSLIRKKREELLVTHMFQDSIQSRVKVTAAMRHKYYEDNKKGYFTFPHVQYAAFSVHSKAGADSLKARLLRGEKAEAILLADSLAGVKRGSIQGRFQSEHGPYQKVLFEELRPGQVTTDGPDRSGDYIVLQSIAFDGGHQLTFAEVERSLDESLQNAEADRMLQQFIARHAKAYRVEEHPERVMHFRLSAG